MTTTLAPLGRELTDEQLDEFHGAAACTIYIFIDGQTGKYLGYATVGDCEVKTRAA